MARPLPVAEVQSQPVERERQQRDRERRDLSRRFTVAAIAAVLTMLASMPLMSQGAAHAHDLVARVLMPVDGVLRRLLPGLYQVGENWLKLGMLVLTIPVVMWSGRQFLRSCRASSTAQPT